VLDIGGAADELESIVLDVFREVEGAGAAWRRSGRKRAWKSAKALLLSPTFGGGSEGGVEQPPRFLAEVQQRRLGLGFDQTAQGLQPGLAVVAQGPKVQPAAAAQQQDVPLQSPLTQRQLQAGREVHRLPGRLRPGQVVRLLAVERAEPAALQQVR
jgi:hypothetical protein